MSIQIQIPTVLRRFADQQAAIAIDGAATVQEALAALTAKYPALEKHLFDERGRLRSFVNIYLGQDDVRHLELKYNTPLTDGAVLTIVPSIAGGSGAALPELTAAEIKRYSRHLILPEVGMDGQRKLKAAAVLVIGAGGLGSPLLAYLAAAGVGRIGIVDADAVDETNLQRQIIHGTRQIGKSKSESAKEFIQNLNPQIRVELWETFLASDNALDIARDYDLLLDGTDNFPTRYLVNDTAYLLGKPNVYASIFRFEGQASVFCEAGGPCYRCLYPEPPPPGLVPSCAEGGVLGVLPGIMGSIQAAEAIKLIIGDGKPLTGRLLRFDALTMTFHEFVLKRDPNCPLCGEQPTITAPVDYHEFCGIPVGEIAELVPDEFVLQPVEFSSRLKSSNGNRPFVLDVRNPEEAEICRIDGARLVPLPELDYRLHEVERGRDIVIYCRSGIRSARAWRLLHEAGFERIYNLDGGILAWAEEVDPAMPRY